jgi:uroporphyrinogen decarboxylase
MTNFYPITFPELAGQAPGDYFQTEIRFVELSGPVDQAAFLRYLERLPADVRIGDIPTLRTYYAWNYHPEVEGTHPLGDVTTVAELAERLATSPLPIARWPPDPDLTRVAAEVAAYHARDLAVMAAPPHLGGELFETAWRLRGFQQFLIDLVRRPALVDYLLDQLTAMTIETSLVLTRAGIDILALDDDIGARTHMLISPAQWRRYFKPRMAAIILACRAVNPDLKIFYHSDGTIEPIIPDLIEIGVDVLNPVQPDAMDPARLKAKYGDRLAFWGTVGTPTLWAWGTPADIRAEVRERIATVGRGGGLIISPAYDLEPEVPWENILAFFEAVDEDDTVTR